MKAVAFLLAAGLVLLPGLAPAQGQKTSWKAEWEKTIEAAKKEGVVVVSVPASAELRKALEGKFLSRFGIRVEAVAGRGSSSVRKIVEESKAGVHYFDVHLGGSESAVTGLLPQGVLEPVEPLFILPEVKEAKNWWGGHIWVDNAKRYIYAFQAYQTENLWYNGQLMKSEAIRSFDDLLDPKLSGKIGMLDPRSPGSGASMWSYLWSIKGENYLKKLIGQKILFSRDQRLLADNLAKGKIALTIGLTYYSYAPFIKAGLPIKPLPTPKEGLYTSGGSGHLMIIKGAPHPNAAKVFVNWLLTKEGQELFTKAIGQGTRRLDVETKWLKQSGIVASKDALTVEQYFKLENQSEEKVRKLREPAAALARKLLD